LRGTDLGAYSQRRDDWRRVWRRPAAAAAGSFAPASRRLGMVNKRAWKLCWCKREAGVARVGVASGQRVEFTVSTTGGGNGASVSGQCTRRRARFFL
jgi:hypothetical protein